MSQYNLITTINSYTQVKSVTDTRDVKLASGMQKYVEWTNNQSETSLLKRDV